MSKLIILSLMAVVLGLGIFTSCAENATKVEQGQQEATPQYLYKVITIENWKNSQGKGFVMLADEDKDFIHLAKEDQVQRIIDKYWADAPEFVVLKIDAKNLPGKLVFETNPGGTNKYYHLYNSPIPLKTIVEKKNVKK